LAIITYGVVGLICAGLIAFGVARADETLGVALLAIGALGLILAAVALPIVLALHHLTSGGQPSPTLSASSSTDRLLAQIYENSMLSDNAKRVLFRDRELELLRRAIEDDMAHGDYNSGLTLCDEMANLFGHREEAEDFRNRILHANHAAIEAKVHQALANLDHILAMRDWARAHQDAASIRRLYPTHHLVQTIDARILQARDEHQRELEARFTEAATRDDVNQAMLLLKELDRYLSREEASRFAEVAQNVVIKHRDGLSMQFKLAVNDHRWAEAAQVGDLIIAEYPNTKMADEVRSMIDVLRVKATQAAVAAAEA
jgi:hypothetical protein